MTQLVKSVAQNIKGVVFDEAIIAVMSASLIAPFFVPRINNVLTNAKHVFSFKLNLESDVKFLEGYLGNDVWILMPPDKRARLKDEPALPEHTFFYRDMDEDRGVLGKV